ncbi:MAG: Hsp20/alpha crystallin family protein [Leptospirales bacterium]|nr:Hsp20/alpha crystallin family protein [Leptospirales bacterium]
MKWNVALRNRFENPFLAFHKDFDEAFGNLFSLKPVRATSLLESRWQPKINVEEDAGRIHVKAELPGINESDLDVTFADNVLTIAGEKKEEEEEKKEKDGRYIISERFFGSFSRSLTLPAGVDADKIKANFKDGVLNIEIPLEESKQSKKIEIH